jgi:hypothetical protein
MALDSQFTSLNYGHHLIMQIIASDPNQSASGRAYALLLVLFATPNWRAIILLLIIITLTAFKTNFK